MARNPQRLITTIDSHTGGHPTRVVTGGLPPLPGASVAGRRDSFARLHDVLRTFLLHEPRGHAAMVGVVPCESARADFGAFFLGSFSYLDMCGHATIGFAVTLDAMGLIAPDAMGHARFTLEVPAGIVEVRAEYRDGRIGLVTLDNVPSRLVARDIVLWRSDGGAAETATDGGPLLADIAYGGNWYGLVDARAAGVRLTLEGTQAAMALGARLKEGLNRRIAAGEIDGVELLDSILFWAPEADADGTTVSRQLVVLGSIKFDRSPCGTGTSARLAQMLARGWLEPGQTLRARNVLGVDFSASAQPLAGLPHTVAPRVVGAAHITGLHSFVLAHDDPLADGFLCR